MVKYQEQALAKLTLTLRVLDKREDGYNNIDAITLYCKDLFDLLSVELQDIAIDPTLKVSQNSTVDKDLNIDNSNLILQAFELYEKQIFEFDREKIGFNFEIEKHIPSGGGLGGGSADCAATFRIMNKAYSNLLDINELVSMANQLGSDIAGCMYSKALTMTGRGDVINIIEQYNPSNDFLNNYKVIIISPDLLCSTPEVYKHYDEIGRPTHVGIATPPDFGIFTDNFHNDLEIAALDRYKELKELKSYIEKFSGESFMVAGSGSSIFTVLDNAKAQDAHAQLELELENGIKHEKIRQLAISALR